MVLKIFKVLFIFLLIALLPSCEAEDFDNSNDFSGLNNAMGAKEANANGFVISLPLWNFEATAVPDSLSQPSDTLKAFPTQKEFTESTLAYVFGLQDLASDMVSSLRTIVSDKENASWMNFYKPYLGAFVSIFDSRVKQWQMETNVKYDDVTWPYHLVVSDLPDGNMIGKSNKALEIFYDYDFQNGVMLFSPSHFDPLTFPEKTMGHNMMAKLCFSAGDAALENTLYVSDYTSGDSPDAFGNLYLNTKLSGNSISFATIVDMPYLWFDKKENIGYSSVMVGGIDISNYNMAVIPCLMANTMQDNIHDAVIERQSIVHLMPQYQMQWYTMKGVPEEDREIYEYLSPSFLQMDQYIGSGREIGERSQYAGALDRAQKFLEIKQPISPYKVSILHVE